MSKLCDQITSNIFLGQFDAHKNINFLKERNINAILVIISSFNILDKDRAILNQNGIIIKHIYAQDTPDFKIETIFEEAHSFIDKYIEKNKNILVCCRMGISRSATVVISYLMTRDNIGLDEAIETVRSKRKIINPNLGFMTSLTILYDKVQNNLHPIY